jgi:hypothetical protein
MTRLVLHTANRDIWQPSYLERFVLWVMLHVSYQLQALRCTTAKVIGTPPAFVINDADAAACSTRGADLLCSLIIVIKQGGFQLVWIAVEADSLHRAIRVSQRLF